MPVLLVLPTVYHWIEGRWGKSELGPDGAEGNRTPDPLLAKQVLSQLSYRPGHTVNMPGGPGANQFGARAAGRRGG